MTFPSDPLPGVAVLSLVGFEEQSLMSVREGLLDAVRRPSIRLDRDTSVENTARLIDLLMNKRHTYKIEAVSGAGKTLLIIQLCNVTYDPAPECRMPAAMQGIQLIAITVSIKVDLGGGVIGEAYMKPDTIRLLNDVLQSVAAARYLMVGVDSHLFEVVVPCQEIHAAIEQARQQDGKRGFLFREAPR